MGKMWVIVMAGLATAVSLLTVPAAKAQTFQLLCTGGTSCTPANTTAVDIQTTASTNPTFDISLSGGDNAPYTVPIVDLVTLIPGGPSDPTPTFTASFNGLPTLGLPSSPKGSFTSGNLWSVLGISGNYSDYNFSSFTSSNRGPDAGATEFQVYEWQAGTNLSTGQIAVSFADGTMFPEGSIFLAVGTGADGVTYDGKTPFTKQIEVSVPETGSMGMLLIAGLVIFGTLLRRTRVGCDSETRA